MAWAKCENCNGIGSHFNYSTNQSDTCYSCGGGGQIPVAAPIKTTLRGRTKGGATRGSQTHGGVENSSNSQQNSQYLLAIIAFFGGGYLVLTNLSDNMMVVGIVALISGFIAYKWYKVIVIIAIIIGVIYFLSNDI